MGRTNENIPLATHINNTLNSSNNLNTNSSILSRLPHKSSNKTLGAKLPLRKQTQNNVRMPPTPPGSQEPISPPPGDMLMENAGASAVHNSARKRTRSIVPSSTASPNPKAKKQVKMAPALMRVDASLSSSQSSSADSVSGSGLRSAWGPASKRPRDTPQSNMPLPSPNPKARKLPRRSYSPIPSARSSTPKPPRAHSGTPATAASRRRSTSNAAGTARKSRASIPKRESSIRPLTPPTFDLTLPIPPASPTDDPLLLIGSVKRQRTRKRILEGWEDSTLALGGNTFFGGDDTFLGLGEDVGGFGSGTSAGGSARRKTSAAGSQPGTPSAKRAAGVSFIAGTPKTAKATHPYMRALPELTPRASATLKALSPNMKTPRVAADTITTRLNSDVTPGWNPDMTPGWNDDDDDDRGLSRDYFVPLKLDSSVVTSRIESMKDNPRGKGRLSDTPLTLRRRLSDIEAAMDREKAEREKAASVSLFADKTNVSKEGAVWSAAVRDHSFEEDASLGASPSRSSASLKKIRTSGKFKRPTSPWPLDARMFGAESSSDEDGDEKEDQQNPLGSSPSGVADDSTIVSVHDPISAHVSSHATPTPNLTSDPKSQSFALLAAQNPSSDFDYQVEHDASLEILDAAEKEARERKQVVSESEKDPKEAHRESEQVKDLDHDDSFNSDDTPQGLGEDLGFGEGGGDQVWAGFASSDEDEDDETPGSPSPTDTGVNTNTTPGADYSPSTRSRSQTESSTKTVLQTPPASQILLPESPLNTIPRPLSYFFPPNDVSTPIATSRYTIGSDDAKELNEEGPSMEGDSGVLEESLIMEEQETLEIVEKETSQSVTSVEPSMANSVAVSPPIHASPPPSSHSILPEWSLYLLEQPNAPWDKEQDSSSSSSESESDDIEDIVEQSALVGQQPEEDVQAKVSIETNQHRKHEKTQEVSICVVPATPAEGEEKAKNKRRARTPVQTPDEDVVEAVDVDMHAQVEEEGESDGDDDDDEDEEEAEPIVQISSADPKAAARAVAILKLHHEYEEAAARLRLPRSGANSVLSRSITPSPMVISTPSKASRRAATPSVFDTPTIAIFPQATVALFPQTPMSPSISLPDILREAEREVSSSPPKSLARLPPHGVVQSSPIRTLGPHATPSRSLDYGSLAPPGAIWETMASPALFQTPTTRPVARDAIPLPSPCPAPQKWTRADWKLLDKCFTAERTEMCRLRGGIDVDVDEMDMEGVVERYLDVTGYILQDDDHVGEDDIVGEFTAEKLVRRAEALKGRQRANMSVTGSEFGSPAPSYRPQARPRPPSVKQPGFKVPQLPDKIRVRENGKAVSSKARDEDKMARQPAQSNAQDLPAQNKTEDTLPAHLRILPPSLLGPRHAHLHSNVMSAPPAPAPPVLPKTSNHRSGASKVSSSSVPITKAAASTSETFALALAPKPAPIRAPTAPPLVVKRAIAAGESSKPVAPLPISGKPSEHSNYIRTNTVKPPAAVPSTTKPVLSWMGSVLSLPGPSHLPNGYSGPLVPALPDISEADREALRHVEIDPTTRPPPTPRPHPKEIVHLSHVSPRTQPIVDVTRKISQPIVIPGRISSGGSVRNLVRSFEDLSDASLEMRQIGSGGALRKTSSQSSFKGIVRF